MSDDHEHDDSATLLIQAAMEGVARADAALEGSHVTRWYVVSEHDWAEGGGKTLSTFRSNRMTPWDALGLLEFARIVEREHALGGMSDDDDEA